jgi:ABC-type polysaccharide/polyol phosphate export permease
VSAKEKITQGIIATFGSGRVLYELTKRDFSARYLGSYLGILWAFIHPLVTTLLLWFIFQVGFKTGEVAGFPFILWLLCGLIPWYFFADAWSNATNSITDNSFLVKKLVFRVSLLPIVKIMSSFVVHVFFLALLLVLLIAHGITPTIHIIQIPIILSFLGLFVLGLSLASSAVVVFIKDLGQLIQALLQFGFWLTPIFWSLTIIPEKYQYAAKFNPLYFVVMGYRAACLEHSWVTTQPLLVCYFATTCFLTFIFGALIFIRLRPHFADVI